MTNAPRPKGLAAMVCAVALGGAVGTLLRDLALRIDNTAWFRSAVGTHGWASRVPWILGAINLIWHVSVTGALLTVAVAVASGIAAAWLGAQSWTK
jgi:fluoride ion exporter CrcB/FEX